MSVVSPAPSAFTQLDHRNGHDPDVAKIIKTIRDRKGLRNLAPPQVHRTSGTGKSELVRQLRDGTYRRDLKPPRHESAISIMDMKKKQHIVQVPIDTFPGVLSMNCWVPKDGTGVYVRPCDDDTGTWAKIVKPTADKFVRVVPELEAACGL